METPTNREVFRHPFLHRLVGWLCTLFFGGIFVSGVVGLLILKPPERPEVWTLWVFLGGIALGAFYLWTSYDRIEVDEQSIWWFAPGRAPRKLDWQRIRCLHERPVMQALELRGEEGEPAIRVRYFLADFSRLRTIIEGHLPNCAALGGEVDISRLNLPLVFRRGWTLYLTVFFFWAALMALGIYALQDGQFLGSAAMLALAVLLIAVMAFIWHSLIVERDRVVLRALLRERKISLSEIDSVDIESESVEALGLTNSVHMRLVMRLTNGQMLQLGSFGNETYRARDVIRAAKEGLIPG